MLTQPKVARILFDESHSEAWTIRRDRAERDAARPPGGLLLRDAPPSGWPAATSRSLPNADRPLTRETLAGADVLVIAHPSDPKWEATVNSRPPALSDAELDAIEEFVRGGGGLIALGETEQDEVRQQPQRPARPLRHRDREPHRAGLRAPPLRPLLGPRPAAGTANGLRERRRRRRANGHAAGRPARPRRARLLLPDRHARPPRRRPGDRPHLPTASPPRRARSPPSVEHGAGRVVVLADSDLFGDDCIGELDNEPLWLNLVYWAAQPAFAGVETVTDSPARADPSWARAEAGGRGAARHPGARRLGRHLRARPRPARRAGRGDLAARAHGLAPPLPAPAGLHRGACAPTCAPGSTPASRSPTSIRSTEAFRPERERRDGIEHLVVFPMYKQNASRDTCFEALIVRVPWPDFVAELERSGYDNPKFVPVNLVDYTSGYDSECAVLFPETFSTAERPPSHFGGIFCDREAERFRRVCGRRRRAPRAQPAARRRLPADLARSSRWTPTSSGT